MENVAEIVALLRKQSQLEAKKFEWHWHGIASEHESEATRRRLA
jgi:hypothetical protein